MLKKTSFFLGILLLIYSAAMFILEGFSLGLIPLAVLAVMFILGGAFWKKAKGISVAAAAIAAIMLVFSVCLASYGTKDNSDFKEDAVIVLGYVLHKGEIQPLLEERLDTAVEYTETNPDATVVLTGGKGEADAMEKYLLEKGVPAEKIIKEDKSTTTKENFAFTSEILEEKFGSDYAAAFITNKFHVYRAEKYAEAAGVSVNHIGADTVWYTIPVNYAREILAVIQLWVTT